MATQDPRDVHESGTYERGTEERDIRFNGRETAGAWNNDSRSMGQLLRDLSDGASTLVRKEVALATAEISEKLSQFKSGMTELGIGAVVVLAGLLVLLDAAVYGLTLMLGSAALSALIVGGVVVVIGMVLMMAARRNLRTSSLTPQRTIAATRRDGELVREHGARAGAEARYARERVKGGA